MGREAGCKMLSGVQILPVERGKEKKIIKIRRKRKMSIYHRDKCTKEEIDAFKIKVINFLNSEKLPFGKVLGLRSYNGEVRIYSGKDSQRMRMKLGRKLVAYKEPDGSYKGVDSAIEHLKRTGGDQCYEQTNEPIITKEYFPVYRADNWEEEKQYLKEQLKA
jgi:hypothetical protein